MRTPTPLIAGLIVAGLCLIGVAPLPYPYYPFLRFIVIVGAAVMIGCCVVRKQYIAIAPLAITGLFFFGVKGLEKEAWAMIDLIAAIFFACVGAWLAKIPVEEGS